MFLFTICPAIRKGSDRNNCIKLWTLFCKFYVLLIKFNRAAPFFLLKLLQSWFHPSASSVLILRNLKRGFALRLPFIAVYWYPTQSFAVFLIVKVFTLIIVMTKTIACIWKFFRLVVFSCLYPSSSSFYPRLKLLSGSQSSPYFVANIIKSMDGSAYRLDSVSQVYSFSIFATKLFDLEINPIFC